MTFIRGKGDTWREVWLEVSRVSLQALSLFVHFATLFKTRDFILVPLFILHARKDYKYSLNQHHGIKFFWEKILINVL